MTVQPTPAMIEFFERRTHEHIARVRNNLMLLATVTGLEKELAERARLHDASKFGDEERIPYSWLTEFHRCRRAGEPFAYPPGVEQQVQQAIQHHVTSNRHHYQFHADPNDMTDIDLIEMVCDWCAMSQEFKQDEDDPSDAADQGLAKHVKFNAEKTAFICRMIAELNRQLAAQREGR